MVDGQYGRRIVIVIPQNFLKGCPTVDLSECSSVFILRPIEQMLVGSRKLNKIGNRLVLLAQLLQGVDVPVVINTTVTKRCYDNPVVAFEQQLHRAKPKPAREPLAVLKAAVRREQIGDYVEYQVVVKKNRG